MFGSLEQDKDEVYDKECGCAGRSCWEPRVDEETAERLVADLKAMNFGVPTLEDLFKVRLIENPDNLNEKS